MSQTTTTGLLVVILAAGIGTRMRSNRAKVLHSVAGRSILGHVLALSAQIGAAKRVVVTGPDQAEVHREVEMLDTTAELFVQAKQQGTADAVLAAAQALERHQGSVLVLYADTMLLRPDTLRRAVTTLTEGHQIVVLGFDAPEPAGYGRLLTEENGTLIAIREEKDASDDERRVTFCNSGVMGFLCDDLVGMLRSIGNDNAGGEYYLTDAVEIANNCGLSAKAVSCEADEVIGINTHGQLAEVEAIYQNRKRNEVMAEGVTLLAPETVTFSFDTSIAPDVVIEPYVFFGPGVTVEKFVTIKGFCHIEHTHLGEGAIVGPYARLRPGTVLGEGAKVGNFVETKAAAIEPGAKVNHLAYIGDARVGRGANVGAGTIICNYDGFAKHHTDIGAGAFVGSNSALVAPVKIGDGAYIGSGSVVTKNVEADALAVTRAPQVVIPGWASKFRSLMSKKKLKSG